MKDTFGITFGPAAQSLRLQLKAQGLRVYATEVAALQADMDAVVRLTVRSLLSDHEKRTVHRKLMREITNFVRGKLGLKPCRSLKLVWRRAA